jgi:hypothetical protein
VTADVGLLQWPPMRANRGDKAEMRSQGTLSIPPSPSVDAAPMEARIGVLGYGLAQAFSRVLNALPGAPLRPTDLSRVLGVDAMLSSRLLKAIQAGDAMAVTHLMPGPEPLRRILKGAERKKVDPGIIRRAGEKVDEFERMIQTEAGDRAGLDAIVSAYLPEAREKYELASKQSAFKAMSQIRGVATEAELSAFFFHPSGDGKAVDRASLIGNLGLRRIRPGACFSFTTINMASADTTTLTLDGLRSDGPHSSLLEQFSTSPTPRFEVRDSGDIRCYWLAGDHVGLRSAVDLVMAEHRPGVMKRYRQVERKRHTGALYISEAPSVRLTFDVFVHRDLYPNTAPELAIYDTVPRGVVGMFDDPARALDRLQLHETIRPLGSGLTNARLLHIARYVEMLEHVCAKLGWNPANFRGYRLDVQYPVYGAQYMLGFKLPEAPEGR